MGLLHPENRTRIYIHKFDLTRPNETSGGCRFKVSCIPSCMYVARVVVNHLATRGLMKPLPHTCYQFLCWASPYGTLPCFKWAPLVDGDSSPRLVGPVGRIPSYGGKKLHVCSIAAKKNKNKGARIPLITISQH